MASGNGYSLVAIVFSGSELDLSCVASLDLESVHVSEKEPILITQ